MTKDIGKLAEDYAVKRLEKTGYKIIERNFASCFGEIDIIANKNEYLVFIEVKYRSSDAYGGGVAAVDKRKQERIRKTAEIYLRKTAPMPYVRFDVVCIQGDMTFPKKLQFEIIEDAFY